MISGIWDVLISREIILITILLIICLIGISFLIKFPIRLGKNNKNNKNVAKKEIIDKIEKPGKILVPDSTYELLKKEDKKRG